MSIQPEHTPYRLDEDIWRTDSPVTHFDRLNLRSSKVSERVAKNGKYIRLFNETSEDLLQC